MEGVHSRRLNNSTFQTTTKTISRHVSRSTNFGDEMKPTLKLAPIFLWCLVANSWAGRAPLQETCHVIPLEKATTKLKTTIAAKSCVNKFGDRREYYYSKSKEIHGVCHQRKSILYFFKEEGKEKFNIITFDQMKIQLSGCANLDESEYSYTAGINGSEFLQIHEYVSNILNSSDKRVKREQCADGSLENFSMHQVRKNAPLLGKPGFVEVGLTTSCPPGLLVRNLRLTQYLLRSNDWDISILD
ncbi:hypothetical protein [Paucibacter sp. KBW04]|uniref:hypothetical protein n=1 Tax=Paucibacter sp. KBW04 TaxID=2153361 RepID=UPI000F567DA3|nr:hypothetical protein [Paucibacter sp. KBW04]